MKNTIIIILSILSIGLGSFIICDKFLFKTDTNKDITVEDNNENNSDTTINYDELYESYLNNLENNIENYNDTDNNLIKINNEIYDYSYTVEINKNKELILNYLSDNRKDKYNNYKISDNVVSMFVVKNNNAGMNFLYYINTNGEIYETNIEDLDTKELASKKLNYKNIIYVTEGFHSDDSGYSYPIFVNIEGNILK